MDGWQEEYSDDVWAHSTITRFPHLKSHDHGKKNSESPIGKCRDTRDRWKMLMMAKKRLKYLAGNIQNINESKINLDS